MKLVRLGDIATIERRSVSPEAIADGTTYVGLENIVSGGQFQGVRPVDNGDLASSKFSFSEEHILYGKLRPYLAKIAVPSFSGVCSTDILPIRVGTSSDKMYVKHFLRQQSVVDQVNALATGANLPRVNPKALETIEIPLPPLDEQRRIAAILDKADELRTKRRQALAHLDTLTQSIFHSMFGAYLEDSNSTVGQSGTVQLGRQRAPKYQTGKYTRPYMRVANVKLNSLDLFDVLEMDFNEKDFEAYRLNYSDILLNEGQSTELVGRPAIWRNEIEGCCFQNTLVRFVADPQLLVPEFALATFLYYFDRGEFAKISSKTSSIAHLGAARFARMPMPTPPLELQQTFASRVAAVERLKENHRKHLAGLDTLFASLQHRAFKGEL